MDTQISITSNWGSESKIALPTPVSHAFGLMLMRFSEMMSAEVRIETAKRDMINPAITDEQCAAAQSREALIEAAFDVIATPELRDVDCALNRLAFLLVTLFQLEDDLERQTLHAQTCEHRDVYEIDGAGPEARQAMRMQSAFFQQFDTLATLQKYGGAGIAPMNDANIPYLIPA